MSTTTPDRATQTDAASARNARLTAAVRGLRTRGRAGSLDRWLLILGGVLLPVGVLVIVLGWYGAAHTPRLFEQIPYLISGGLLGVGLVLAGGFVYFAYWLTLLVREGRAQAERAETALARIETLLASGGGAAAARGVGAALGGDGAPVGGSPDAVPTFVATANGTMLHRPDCPVVANKTRLRAIEAGTPGYAPCRICEPLAGA